MVKMRSIERNGVLKKKHLGAIIRYDVRWSSAFEMIERYRKTKEFLPTTDLDIMPLLLSDEEKPELDVFYQNLDKINNVTKVFQAETGMTLAKIQQILEGLIRVFPR